MATARSAGREARRIQSHLEACWKCRTGFAELQETVSGCVRYRLSVLHPSLPEPPVPWSDIYRQFDELDASEANRPLVLRLWEFLRGVAVQPRRWAPAIAMLVIAVVVIDQFRNAPSVRAAELLQKAATAQEARPAKPRRVQISTGNKKLTRVIGAARVNASREEMATWTSLQALFELANYSWENPLSAASFASWRDGLAEKHDKVTKVGDSNYRIRTTTDASELTEATLDLTMKDLRAVEGTLRFRGQEIVQLTELADSAPTVERSVERADAPPKVVPPRRARSEAPELARPATPGEELQVLAVLHRLGADLGEPVEVTRDGAQVVVRGMGVTPQLGEQIHDELTGMPRVSVRLSEPALTAAAIPSRPSESVSLRPEIARLQARLESQFGGRAGLEQFTDEVLGAGDELMSRVHALRRLAERFPPVVESQLRKDERQLLSRLRREHAVGVAGLALAVEERTRPALLALGARTPASSHLDSTPRSWQSATNELFQDARAAESALAAMLGGAAAIESPDELPDRVFSSVSRLRARAADYVQNSLE